MREHGLQRSGRPDNLLEHGCLGDLFPQRQVFVLESVFQALDLFEGALQPGPRLPLFGDVRDGADKLDELAAVIRHRVTDGVEMLECSVGKNDPVVRLVGGSPGLGLREEVSNALPVVGMNPHEDELGSRRVLIWCDAEYAMSLRREGYRSRGHIVSPAARVTQPLGFQQRVLTAPQPLFRCLSLVDVRHQDVPADDVTFIVVKREAA